MAAKGGGGGERPPKLNPLDDELNGYTGELVRKSLGDHIKDPIMRERLEAAELGDLRVGRILVASDKQRYLVTGFGWREPQKRDGWIDVVLQPLDLQLKKNAFPITHIQLHLDLSAGVFVWEDSVRKK